MSTPVEASRRREREPSPRSGERSGAHGGRPRDPSRDEAIREAVLDLVAELGYDRVTIDDVAARAGSGKATIYRRWSSKADLVMDALSDLQRVGDLPDTGSLRGDLHALVARVSAQPGSRPLAVMQGLASAMLHDLELRGEFTRQFVAPRRAVMAEILKRATARGEMAPGKDIDLLTSVIPALMLYHDCMNSRLSKPAFARHVVDQLLIPAATAPVAAEGEVEAAPVAGAEPEGSTRGS